MTTCSSSTAPTGCGETRRASGSGGGRDRCRCGAGRAAAEASRLSRAAGARRGRRATPSGASSWSILNISACSDRSAWGWVAFSSAISSWMRGSLPSFTAAIAAGQEVDRAQDLALREALGLRREAVGVLGGHRERVRHVPERLHHEQVTQVRGQVAHELREVAPRLGQRLHRQERLARVAVGERLARREHQLGVGDAEDLEHVVELHLVAAVGDELLERPERVAERARWPRGRASPPRGRELESPPRPRPAAARRRSARATAAGSRSGGSGR